jgi:hypothetical protein
VVTAVGIAALLVVPGTVLARLTAGTSWLRSVALSPLLSVVLLSFAGAILGLARIPATLLSAGGLVVLGLSVVGWLRRRTVRDRPLATGEDDRWTVLGAGIGAALAASVWGLPATWLTRPPQSWDYLWHQWVVATISRRGLLGPQNLVPVDGIAETIHTYQHGAHLAAGLVVGDGVAAVAAGLNLTLWLAVVVFLPLGMAVLTRSVTDRRVAVLLAPALVVMLPNSVFARFGLFAFVVGLSLLPAVALAGVIQSRERTLVSGILLTLSLTGLLLVHAHAFLAAALLLGAVWVGDQLDVVVRRDGSQRRPAADATGWPWLVSGLALFVPALAALLLAAPWLFFATGVYGSGAEAALVSAEHVRAAGFEGIGEVLRVLVLGQRLSDFPGPANPVLGVALPLATLVLLWRRRHLGLVLFVVVLAGMTVLVAGGSGRFRELLATPWLGDWWRPAAVLTIVGALVIALAVAELSPRPVTAGREGSTDSSGAQRRGRVALVALLGLALGVALVGQIPNTRDELAAVYGPLARSRAAETMMDSATLERELASEQPLMVISPLEVRAMEQLADLTPAGTRVLNWWGDGSPWMYSAAGVVPVRTYATHSVSLRDARQVDDALADPASYDEAIDALVALDVCSAYAGEGHILSRGLPDPPAWKQLTDLPGFELVYRNDHARVYRAADPRLTANC